MKRVFILVLAILLLTGCNVQNSNKEAEKSLNGQEEKVELNDKTDKKEKEEENTSNPSEKTNNKKNGVEKENNKTSNEKKTKNKKTTNTTQTTETKKTNKSSKKDDNKKNKKTPVENEKVPQKNDKKEDKVKKEEKHKHKFTVNGGWYKTSDEAYRKFQSISGKWNKKYESGEISWDEYCHNCPNGYEIFKCTCGMQGLNLIYD